MNKNNPNAREAQSGVSKDNPTKEEIETAENAPQGEVPADNPNMPTEILDESAEETADRHVASTELPVKDVTDPDSQAREHDEEGEDILDEDGDPEFASEAAEDAGDLIVPGAAAGPKVDGSVRNDQGKVAYAPPGSHNAAMAGVQQDASGHVDSVGTDNSHKSGTRA